MQPQLAPGLRSLLRRRGSFTTHLLSLHTRGAWFTHASLCTLREKQTTGQDLVMTGRKSQLLVASGSYRSWGSCMGVGTHSLAPQSLELCWGVGRVRPCIQEGSAVGSGRIGNSFQHGPAVSQGQVRCWATISYVGALSAA